MSISLGLSEHLAPAFFPLQAEAGSKYEIKCWLSHFAFSLDRSWRHWSETTCLSRCLPGYALLLGSIPTCLCWLIKMFRHQTLMLGRVAGASAGCLRSRYHHALAMVIERQLCIPCIDQPQTMQDNHKLCKTWSRCFRSLCATASHSPTYPKNKSSKETHIWQSCCEMWSNA